MLNNSNEEIRSFVERLEQLNSEDESIKAARKEIFEELKGRGFDAKAIRTVVALRKRDPDDIANEEATLDLYKQALGM